MTREERLEVAFKIAGIGFIAMALGAADSVTWIVQFLSLWLREPTGPRGNAVEFAAFSLAAILATFTVGVVLISFGRRLSGLFAEGPEHRQFLHFGILIAAVVFLLSLMMALLAAVLFAHGSIPPHVIAYAAFVVVTVAFSGVVSKMLYRRMTLQQGEGSSAAAPLALGIMVVCAFLFLCYFARLLVMFAGSSLAADGEGALAAQAKLWHLGLYVASALGLTISGVFGFYSGRMAVKLSRPSTDAEASCVGALSADSWLALAVFSAAAYVSVRYVTYLIHSPLHTALPAFLTSGWWPGVVESLACQFVLPICGAIVALYAAGRYGWKLGARLSPRPAGEAQTHAETIALYAEAALTLVALYFSVTLVSSAAGRAIWGALAHEGGGYAARTIEYDLAALAGVAALALRGDLAWLFWRRKATGATLTPARRAAVLRPWLVLMGLWFVLDEGPYLAVSTWAAVWRIPGPDVEGLQALPGLVMLLAASWVARRLSYGPLIPAIGGRLIPAIRRRLNYGRD